MKRQLVVLLLLALVLAACAPAATPQVIEKQVPVEKQVTVVIEKEKVVEKVVTATAAPAKAGPKDVIIFKSGTEVVGDHPFFRMVEEYNQTHPNVEVKLEMATWAAGGWFDLPTKLAAGDPPDVMRVSIGGVGLDAINGPYLIDVKPYLTEAEIADYGPDILAPATFGEKIVIWPQDRDWGTCIVANDKLLEAAGVDWKKIHEKGWTFDEFREAAKKLTKDTNGDGTPDVYGFGWAADGAGYLLEFAHRAGVPDGSANVGLYNFGNKWSLTGPGAVTAAKVWHDLIYVDGSVPKGVTGITDHMALYYSGKLAMAPFWHGVVGAIKAYNKSIDDGKVQGEKADFNPILLPWPYNPPDGPNVNLARTTGLALFRQKDYKGDEHTQNVVDFVRYLTSPINLATYANWEGTIPAKASALNYSSQVSDPQIAWWVDWGRAHAIWTYPFGHPEPTYWGDILVPNVTDLLLDKTTPEAMVDKVTKDGQAALDKWVAANPDLAKAWATVPENWPQRFMVPIVELEKK